MVAIRTIEARQGLSTGSAPSTRIDDAVGEGLRSIGGSIQQAASAFSDMDLRRLQMQQKNAEFRTEEQFQRFTQDTAAFEAEAQTKIDPSGEGYTQKVSEEYNKKAGEFIEGVPENLRPRMAELLATHRNGTLNRVAAKEADQRNVWFRDGVTKRAGELGSQVLQEPSVFDNALSDGERLIDATGLPPVEKKALKQGLKQSLLLSKAENYKRTDPGKILGPAASPVSGLVRAMINVESSGNADAVSPKGAAGLMQVMPATGAEIAAEIGDKNFPTLGGEVAARDYLKRKDVNIRYGTYYMGKMLKRYNGDVDAALIAYNGGARRADEWLSAGRNDSVLPKETADYYKKVRGQEGSSPHFEARQPIVTAHQVGRSSKADLNGVHPVVIETFQKVQDAVGQSIPIVSAFRDANRNLKAGGAKNSQHIGGNALDLDVSSMSIEKRKEIIRTASAAGFTGIGVYQGSIHLDVGPKRSWGPSHHSESVPDWAQDVINEHLSGSNKPLSDGGASSEGNSLYLSDEFKDLPIGDRLKIYDEAQSAQRNLDTQANTVAAAQYEALKDSIDLGIETGKIASRQNIMESSLNDGDKAVMIRRLGEKGQEAADVSGFISGLQSGAAKVNPFDESETKVAEKAFDHVMKTVAPETAAVAERAFVEASGYVPKSSMADLRAGAIDSSPKAFNEAMARADGLERLAPKAFAASGDGGEVLESLATWRKYVSDFGLSQEEAAKRIVASRDPAKKVSREVLKPEAEKFLKEVTLAEAVNVFDVSVIGGPSAPIGPDQANLLTAEYKELVENAFYENNGDRTAARAIAQEDLKKRWGVSEVSGSAHVMRLPPENRYPAPDGNYDYLREDMLTTAKEWVKGAFPERTVDNVTLVPDAMTRADYEANKPPRYRLFYQFTGPEGVPMFDEVLGGHWIMPIETLSKKFKAAKQSSKNEGMERRGQAQFDEDGGRERSLEAFTNGPLATPDNPNPAPKPQPPKTTAGSRIAEDLPNIDPGIVDMLGNGTGF